jgi:hypothetical protein
MPAAESSEQKYSVATATAQDRRLEAAAASANIGMAAQRCTAEAEHTREGSTNACAAQWDGLVRVSDDTNAPGFAAGALLSAVLQHGFLQAVLSRGMASDVELRAHQCNACLLQERIGGRHVWYRWQ